MREDGTTSGKVVVGRAKDLSHGRSGNLEGSVSSLVDLELDLTRKVLLE